MKDIHAGRPLGRGNPSSDLEGPENLHARVSA